MGLDSDEKALIMASAVLGVILLSLVAFAALYKSFISEYSATYNRQMKLVQNTLNPAGNVSATSSDPIVPASPTFVPMPSPSPEPVADSQPEPPVIESKPVITNPLKVTIQAPEPAAPIESPAKAAPAGDSVWGNTSAAPQRQVTDWAVEDTGNEFFSADEQARIWQELREAEEKAARGGPTASEQAKEQATLAKTASDGAVDADLDTKFGFDEDDLGDDVVEDYVAPPSMAPDYIAPDTLVDTGERFDPMAGGNIKAEKMSTMKQATRGVNNAEWWK